MLAGLVVTAVVVACLCTACGTTDRSTDATATVERFQAALDSNDGKAACGELSEETASALEQQQGDPCEVAILTLELPSGGEVSETSVYVTSAFVSLLEGGTLFLDEASDGWEIAAAGCTPAGPDRPYDCELEN